MNTKRADFTCRKEHIFWFIGCNVCGGFTYFNTFAECIEGMDTHIEQCKEHIRHRIENPISKKPKIRKEPFGDGYFEIDENGNVLAFRRA